MDFSVKPIAASCLFQGPLGVLVVRRWWEGAERLGLPTAEWPDSEPIESLAHRLIAPNDLSPGASKQVDIAIVRSIGPESHLGGSEEYQWDGHPVALNVFAFYEADIVAPMSGQATYVDLDAIIGDKDLNPVFDVTIVLLRQLLRQKQAKTAAA